MSSKPALIEGNTFTDDRGTLQYCNSLDLGQFRRYYTICHHDSKLIRGWQGHKLESKVFCVLKGSFEVHTCSLTNFTANYEVNNILTFELSFKKHELLLVPEGFATALRSIQQNSLLLVFSSLSLEDGIKDDYRFDLEKFPIYK